ncbi:MAG: tRNA (adenosine(37)-N6)-threonylcarbamoyltransferase complex ATPase subunit type 1 TsaE [Flavobacteriaceae bacterium]|jgi:tRNA threonylcarbamoyladenosine biosynthesis protein TsaE|tara:strand:+ start:47 stop:490 length:444 start_codon:yes stop_codon:yes gene_type:complete
MSSVINYKLKDLSSTARLILNQVKTKHILFNGDMGSGKTTLISALVKELGGNDLTSSPTFSIVNEYEIPNDIVYHFDFYRINDLHEALDMGIEDYFESKHWNFIEWPDKVYDLLPEHVTQLDISLAEDGGRILEISEKTLSAGWTKK